MEQKKCCGCELLLNLNDFHKQASKKDGRRTKCKSCSKIETKKLRDKKNIKTKGLYPVWNSMKARCLNKKYSCYHRYGGRGIKVCDEWRSDFKSFFNWCISNGHKKGLQIDRINNDGNYEPSNCRWVSAEVNMQNSSNAKLNAEKVIRIRELSLEGFSNKDIAKKYNVSEVTIICIKNGKSWKNIKGGVSDG
jgi:hypothetical protein